MRVLLTGFAGSGKSTVGQLVAKELGTPWVDLDRAIEAHAGQTVEEIFATGGEAAFRAVERTVALGVLDRGGPLVVSSGGGTLLDPDVRRAAGASCLVVVLHVGAETAIARVAGSGRVRPLFAGDDPMARARELLALRSGLYGLAHAGVQTEGRSPAAIGREVVAYARGQAVPVSLGARSYPVWIGRGLLPRAADLVADAGLGARSMALVCDRAVARRWGGPLSRSLARRARRLLRIVQAPGEARKTLRSADKILGRLLRVGWERTDPVLALGGGVVGDLAGFVAAMALRGVPFVQMPTTLLAQADASVGGKVGVNHAAGKNLLGAFHQPRLVIADLDTLCTLPSRQLRAGLAEIVKCGVVRDDAILDLLEGSAEAIVRGDLEAIEEPLRRAIVVKAGVVSRDEREGGERRILNFGHTVGHAVEVVQRYRGLLHGEAVSVGMVAALRVGQARGVTPPALTQRVERLLERLGLPVVLPQNLPAGELRTAMAHDKKVMQGRVRFVVAVGAVRTEEILVAPDDVTAALEGRAGRKLGGAKTTA